MSLTNKKIDGVKGVDVEGNKVTPTTDAAFGQKGVQTVLRRQNPDQNEKTRNKTTFTIPASSSTHGTTRNAHRFTAATKTRYVMLMSVVCQQVGVQPGCSVDGSLKGDNAAVEAALQKLRMEK